MRTKVVSGVALATELIEALGLDHKDCYTAIKIEASCKDVAIVTLTKLVQEGNTFKEILKKYELCEVTDVDKDGFVSS